MARRLGLLRWLSPFASIASIRALPRSIRDQVVRMSVVFGALLVVVAWQWQFVLSSMNSNIYLNAIIIATFGFGVFLAYRNMLRMRNEDLAFQALREMHDDAKTLLRGKIDDPLWRHYRCKDLAVVYDKPEVLGHAYQLIYEQLASGREVHLSAGAMQSLVDSVQVRLDERKSLTQYIAGILILMGLIGTFIGLMQTLGSVGTILASLDVQGTDPTGAIASLLDSLQVPLRGMAVGFSSSLNGAVGSLVLSLMVRFSAIAFSQFTQDFEEWLSNVAKIDDTDEVPAQGVAAAQGNPLMEGRQLELVLRAARISVSSNARLNTQLDSVSGALVELARTVEGQTRSVDRMLASITELQDQTLVLSQASAQALDATRVAATHFDAKHEIIGATAMLSRQLQIRDSAISDAIKSLAEVLAEIRQREAEAANLPTPQSNEAYRLLDELKASLLSGDFGRARDRLWDDEIADTAPAASFTPAQRASVP